MNVNANGTYTCEITSADDGETRVDSGTLIVVDDDETSSKINKQ